ncbi:MFS transporter permease [Desulfonema ishimotonii]|nr:MFS transporter permease [Desulfonema ishimotonii]
MKEIIIPKENAVFWLDGNGAWHNVHGRFRNRKIIGHFHASIEKDEGGYYVTQINCDRREKVYFRYEDTALFVTDLKEGEPPTLILNTKKEMALRPDALVVRDDSLYLYDGDDRIKFSERVLFRIADMIEFEDEQYFIRIGGRRYEIGSQAAPPESPGEKKGT